MLVISVGGLGSPVALYLAAAGAGTLGIADGDTVELSNLQRRVIYFTPDVGRSKVDSAKEKLREINPHVRVNTCHENLTADNILDIVGKYDFIVDGTDNFPAKYLINDACVMDRQAFHPRGHPALRGASFHPPSRYGVLPVPVRRTSLCRKRALLLTSGDTGSYRRDIGQHSGGRDLKVSDRYE